VPYRTTLKTVPSGVIAIEIGADGTFLRFDCECEDAIPYCKAACCSLPGIAVNKNEEAEVRNAASKLQKGLPILERDSESVLQMVKGSDGACNALCRSTRSCKIYSERPATCKDFHCTTGEDMRGWRLDIERHNGCE